jgi:bifunctional DNA-binding transcriptional regulator/antitoxin component of YhaV-PrlF toxin-antitoxin module
MKGRPYVIQENGQVTLPIEFRRRHRLEKGDVVIFEETSDGLLISVARIQAVKQPDALPEQADGTKDEPASR